MNATEALFTVNITPNKLREIANELEFYAKNSLPGQTVIYKLTSNFALQWIPNNVESPNSRDLIMRKIGANG